jgi:hypothetical protein
VGYHAGALLTALRCTRVNVKKYGSTLLSLAYAVISGYLVVVVSPTPLISRYAPWLLFFAVLDNPLHIRAYLVSIRRRRKQSQNAPIQINVPIWVLPALASAPGTDWRESQSTLRLPCSFSLYTISMRSSQRGLRGLYQVFLFAY